jgi:replicative DNA helicase
MPATGNDNRSIERLGVLPHNLEAEKKVLGSMLLDREVIPDVVRLLQPEDFYQPAHQEIFRHLAELYNNNKPSDLTLLVESLQRANKLDDVGGYMYLATLETNVFSSSAAPENAQLVQDKATLRNLMGAADRIMREARDEIADIPELIERAEGEIYRVNRSNQNGGFLSLEQLMTESVEEIMHLYQTKESRSGLKTGFKELDNIISGFDNTALVILAARPSMGKTAFALNLVHNVISRSDSSAVAFFSLEMGAEQLAMRLLAGEAEVNSYKILQGKINDKEWERLRETASHLMNYPLFIDDTPGISIMQLRSRARRLKARYKNLGLIVVDYLQLMQGSSTKKEYNRQQEVAEISRGLKGLAKELRVPVLALSQLSRSIEQRGSKDKPAEPQLSDLRESGSIEQDADIVMFVHRERKEAEKGPDGLPVKNQTIPAAIIVGKNRSGPIGRAEMIFIPGRTKFADVGDELRFAAK